MRDEKLICCCGSSGWAKVIGWYELTTNAIQIAIITWVLISWALDSFHNVNDTLFMAGATLFLYLTPYFGLKIIIAKLIFKILTFSWALVLLRGSYMRNPRWLQVWIFFTVIKVALLSCILGSLLIYLGEIGALMPLVFWLGIQTFCVWVVIVHRNEIMSALHLDGLFPVYYQYPYKCVSSV